MANPQAIMQPLNRLKASVSFPNITALNVTPAFMNRNQVSIAPEGAATTSIPVAVSAVPSPEPYQIVTVTINLLKVQQIVNTYKAQYESNTVLGPCTVRPDTTVLNPYDFVNSWIVGLRELAFSGEDAGWTVTLGAVYQINNDLWD